jgi:type II secretory pathway pseudopilin PulG
MKLATVQNKVGTARCAVITRVERVELAVDCPTNSLESISKPPPSCAAARRPYQGGFTLVETMAALVFMAIVIPATVEALRVAAGAGEIAVRKGEAAHIADRVLNQSLVMTNWSTGAQSGTAQEGSDDFHWTLKSQNWPQDTMELLTADVTFNTQGHEYSVELSTLANLQTQSATTPTQNRGSTP